MLSDSTLAGLIFGPSEESNHEWAFAAHALRVRRGGPVTWSRRHGARTATDADPDSNAGAGAHACWTRQLSIRALVGQSAGLRPDRRAGIRRMGAERRRHRQHVLRVSQQELEGRRRHPAWAEQFL